MPKMLRQKFLPDVCHVFPLTGVSILSSKAQPEASGVEYVSCESAGEQVSC